MRKVIRDAGGRAVQLERIPYAGHQDCMIGKKAREATLAKIDEFLDLPDASVVKPSTPPVSDALFTPWIGPVITWDGWRRSFRVGSRPTQRQPEGVILVRVDIQGDIVYTPGGGQVTEDYILNHSFFITSGKFQKDHWDKFEFPPPPGGNGPNYPGNGWLVMVVYHDMVPQTTDAETHFYFSTQSENLLPFERPAGKLKWPAFPLNPEDPGEDPGEPPPVEPIIDPGADPSMVVESTLLPSANYEAMAEVITKLISTQMFPLDEDSEEDPPESEDEDENPYTPVVIDTRFEVDRIVDENLDLRDGLVPDPIDPVPNECRFFLTSCQYPPGLLDGPMAYASYKETLDRINGLAGIPRPNENLTIVPEFGVFAGDQIYADASAGLFDPSVRDGRFELPYQHWLRFPYVRELMRKVPSFMTLDDHEINDNWERIFGPPGGDDADNQKLRDEGVEGYQKYQRGTQNTPQYAFSHSGFHFHVEDTRSSRHARLSEKIADADICDGFDVNKLQQWIQANQVGNQPVFVVTPSMFLPRHKKAGRWNKLVSGIVSDSWDGYPKSLFDVLRMIWAQQIKNVIFLSGDEHFGSCAKITASGADGTNPIIIHSVHTAAAYAPYPFANGHKSRHLDDEELYFDTNPVKIFSRDLSDPADPVPPALPCRLKVENWYPPAADGMTYIRVHGRDDRQAGRTIWGLSASFKEGAIHIDDLES
jgi:hypothetical protein